MATVITSLREMGLEEEEEGGRMMEEMLAGKVGRELEVEVEVEDGEGWEGGEEG